ncbi:MAG: hypothetical protein IJI01_13065 [Butyrivibrio sp.]|uniref:hypothetical protein n=1 Tax=Butyrivibrio sp. TaxID=28121 RepID=UPI0025BF4AAA|nr:hypothetical protein [Butyrivibrio sp.]MBQ6589590.1 hypothetical protein [Butyrivibrio sp.]
MSKYNDVMNKIEVTEDMRNRILQNIAKEFDDKPTKDADSDKGTAEVTEFKVNDSMSDENNVRSFQPKSSFYKFTKYAGLAAAVVILLVGATVVFGPKEKSAMESATMTEMALEGAHEAAADVHHEAELIKGSWVKYDSVETLASAAGVDYADIAYLSSISSETDYYLDDGEGAVIVYDVTGNQVTVSETVASEKVTSDTEDFQTEANAYMAEETGASSKLDSALDALGGSGIGKIGKKDSDSEPAPRFRSITIGDVDVSLIGTEEGYTNANWTVNGIEYQLECVEKISLEEMTELMNNILAF